MSLIVALALSLGSYLWSIWESKTLDRKLRQLLGERTIEEVLEASDFTYGWFQQGDEGYRIWPKENADWRQHVGDLWYEIDAQIWIVKQFNESRDLEARAANRERDS